MAIRCDSRPIRRQLRRLQLELWLTGLVLRVRKKWWTWRPGLAPEIYNPLVAPWLSRTAGRPILRPGAWACLAARIARTSRELGLAFDTMARQAQAAVQAFQVFGGAAGRAMRAAGRSADSTAGKVH